jgi:hypothetical protein
VHIAANGTFSPSSLPPGASWRQVAKDANHDSAPSMSDQKELQRQNQQLIRQNRRLERELQKKEKALAVDAA